MTKPIPDKDAWIADRTAVQAHLNMLQAIIARLATGSASSKTWCLALTGAVTSLAGATHQPAVLGFVVVVVAIFWFLDVRYLAQEKAYRDLFNAKVTRIREQAYDMADAFDLAAPTDGDDIKHALKSWSTWPLYLTVVAAYVVAWWLGWIWLLAPAAKC